MMAIMERSSEATHQECAARTENTRLTRYRSLAQENLQRQKFDAAQRCLEKAVYIAVRTYGPTHLEVGTNLLELGTVLHRRGFVEAAEPLMARARRILKSVGN
ncbi:MAG: tetratricopeptide repeat protein [Candidatus Melainabacteria bacterium]|nr:tetratricopeptide repeat protein [Candidatus Melainabacteria bacterium]